MSDEYHKITTVYKRDPKNMRYVIEGEWALPEFEYLRNCQWIFTEKVDGTNIRVHWQPQEEVPVRFGGKTENAQLPTPLIDKLSKMFHYQKFVDAGFGTDTKDYITLYGEGYGARIQKGGGNYKKDDVDFVLFDVRVGNWWLKREAVEEIATKLGIKVVPIVGEGTLIEAVEMVKAGLNSQWGDFIAEGLVCRPKVDLFARNGDRIITKIKTRDFPFSEKLKGGESTK